MCPCIYIQSYIHYLPLFIDIRELKILSHKVAFLIHSHVGGMYQETTFLKSVGLLKTTHITKEIVCIH